MNKNDKGNIIINCPNYLINISSLANCFREINNKTHLLWQHYFISQLMPFASNYQIHKGNIVNDLLDEIIHTPIDKFDIITFLYATFRKRPLEYCTLLKDDKKFKEFYLDIQKHYKNLISIVYKDFSDSNINIKIGEVILEPSFINEQLGIQGRLDLLQISANQLKIIELKSGKTPFPSYNKKKVSANHAAQAQLYHLLIDKLKIFNKNKKKQNIVAICYSSAIRESNVPTSNLRFISHDYNPYFFEQVMDLRNQILKKIISIINSDTDEAIDVFFKQLRFSEMNIKLSENLSWFKKDYDELEKHIKSLDHIERSYFYAFYRFILLEQYLYKVGNQNTYGQSALWRKNQPTNTQSNEKELISYEGNEGDSFISTKDSIDQLKVKRIDINEDSYTLTLQRHSCKKENEVDCFDFRRGDTCVIYRKDKDKFKATDGQLSKCILASTLNKENELTLYFRHKQNKQFITSFFNDKDEWVLEHDYLDIGFLSMIRGLQNFSTQSKHRKQLLLGIIPPKKIEIKSDFQLLDKLNNPANESEIISLSKKILANKEYFLLSGPPGTGKTKIVIKNLIYHLINNTDEKILILAYTNQAVGELCNTILSIANKFQKKTDYPFIRIGSIFSAGEEYAPYFIQSITKKIISHKKRKRKRKELHRILYHNHIYIGTLASLQQNNLIFSIINTFDTCIIDEASQILEPQVIEILSRSKRFFMVGDEKQLPSISLQSTSQAKRFNPSLKERINMTNLQHSYFERMIKNAKKKNWYHCLGTLSFQGRMHKEISCFPNRYFYQNELKISGLPHQIEQEIFHLKQRDCLKQSIDLPKQIYEIRQLLIRNRLIFINCPLEQGYNIKTHDLQAFIVGKLVQQLLNLGEVSNKSISHNQGISTNKIQNNHSIGIITIYRNQIAKIKSQLNNANVSLESLVIDTVERYQGSQKDHIIISLSINSNLQLDFLRKNAEEHVGDDDFDSVVLDKKLNVMLTRARKQLIILGNETLLSRVSTYKKLMKHIKDVGSYINHSQIFEVSP